jgi:dihydrolipoyl dehydrogenase
MANERYEVAIIGSGPGGYVAGIRAGQLGKKAIVIEREQLGGVCLNWGCIPSKAIIHAANLRGEMHEMSGFGIFKEKQPAEVDAAALQTWKNDIIKKQRAGIANLLKSNGCDHKKGEAKITGPHSLEVTSENGGQRDQLQFDNLIIATGAAVIEIPGFKFDGELVGYARHGVSYDPIPKELVIIGGGVIGCELGMAYAKLGSKVTIVEMLGSILPGNDPDLLKPVERRMKRIGIEALTSAKAKGWTNSAQGGGEVEVEIGGQTRKIHADKILVAVGFRPNTQGLGLETAGVKLDQKGWIPVDEQCRTNVAHVYAIGDVTGPPLLAHRASHMAEVAAEVVAGKPSAFDVMAMPLGVFTDPEVAIAGLTEAQAKEKGYEVQTGLFPIAALGRAAAMNATDGVVKVVIDTKSDLILGVGITAANANDLVAEVCLALEMGALAEDVGLTVHVHPTLSEGVMEAAKAARGEAVHILNRRRGTAPRAPQPSAPPKT